MTSFSGKRIGIYAGTFDPVHAGHIGFALQAMEFAGLDRIYFLPERRPRTKPGVEHFAHRVAMVKRACRPYPYFKVMELVDVSFSTERTLPKLLKEFDGAQLAFLFGSDVIAHLPSWPNVQRLLKTAELVIGVRSDQDQTSLQQQISAWKDQPVAVTMFESYAADVSSGKIREGLRDKKSVPGLLHSVAHYSNRNWLYVTVK
ncbi:MAG: Cytidyltransferase-related protein [Candidatus Saccharibacteria bacterium]|nr:Cytidyltransferase-related protein [Candidatus Saccharibacteria bacterium]